MPVRWPSVNLRDTATSSGRELSSSPSTRVGHDTDIRPWLEPSILTTLLLLLRPYILVLAHAHRLHRHPLRPTRPRIPHILRLSQIQTRIKVDRRPSIHRAPAPK